MTGIYRGPGRSREAFKAVDWCQNAERVELPRGWRWARKQMVCPNPNCGYRGAAAEKAKGSRAAMWLLMCFLLLPGLIYGMLMSGKKYCCPKCRTVVDLA